MGVMENMIHAESSSKVKSLINDSEVKHGGETVLENGGVCKVDVMTGIKFKRRRLFAVRDFPPGCGSKAMRRFGSRSVEVKSSENGNVVAEVDVKVDVDVVSVSDGVKLVESGSDLAMVEAVEVEPVSVCLPSEEDVVRDFPGETGSTCSESVKVLEDSGSVVTENAVRDIVVYEDEESLGGRIGLDHTEPLEIERFDDVIVPSSSGVMGRRKAKKGVAFHSALKLKEKEVGEGSKMRRNKGQERAGKPRIFEVRIPPSVASGTTDHRNRVKETLRLFNGAARKLQQEQEAKPERERKKRFRVDFEAAKILKSKGKYLNVGVQIMGTVPGVEVGDEFQYRMELNILGVHRPSQGGIDFMKYGDREELVATSIVASGGYDDTLDNTDVLIYTGQGGNVMPVKKKGEELKAPKDQELVLGNLALYNSVEKKTPVRVIRGKKKSALDVSDGKAGNYVYDGLYVVEGLWTETGTHGKKVFKFKLRRIPGQRELSWKVVNNTKKSKFREGICKLDISEGKEELPISAVNEIDDEKPPMFIYTVKMIYPDWCRPAPPKSCGCTEGCNERCKEEARKCTCVRKNDGEIPYNYDGAIVGAKTLVYECGPLCKCPPSCHLRVTQHGIKFQLEIFKTESRGWGVRSLKSIPSGSFICEYVGELLEESEAERRIGNDEYLFDIGNRYDDSLAQGMSELMPGTQAKPAIEEEDDEAGGFTIDAATKGNIGRFINHSCSPNLYAQNVLYDHDDKRIPHVMFFAMDNIPPLQELCYDYNYALDQVRDSQGNIKKKLCYCGSAACRGRLY